MCTLSLRLSLGCSRCVAVPPPIDRNLRSALKNKILQISLLFSKNAATVSASPPGSSRPPPNVGEPSGSTSGGDLEGSGAVNHNSVLSPPPPSVCRRLSLLSSCSASSRQPPQDQTRLVTRAAIKPPRPPPPFLRVPCPPRACVCRS